MSMLIDVRPGESKVAVSPWAEKKYAVKATPETGFARYTLSASEYHGWHDAMTMMVSGEAPEWLLPAINRLARYSGYPQNWNGYGERSISVRAVQRATGILVEWASAAAMLPSPSAVVPLATGGIQIEWGEADIIVEVAPDGTAEGYVAETDFTWPLREPADFTQLVGFVDHQ